MKRTQKEQKHANKNNDTEDSDSNKQPSEEMHNNQSEFATSNISAARVLGRKKGVNNNDEHDVEEYSEVSRSEQRSRRYYREQMYIDSENVRRSRRNEPKKVVEKQKAVNRDD
ncbi:hypothetical protein QYM36_009295 [Artemia franciscana]|uniref:Uncharacterized protein n=1 Tax=Artemia franciscana TaxID=6661 RepID=A0AA88I145_ARTSF|nr:hypothetical protein QYM36_009295 [Artemia franciscana]